ncbi:MAG: hypothetical protein QW051_03175 [Candidatus Aenigmatarchaeota archaeon]
MEMEISDEYLNSPNTEEDSNKFEIKLANKIKKVELEGNFYLINKNTSNALENIRYNEKFGVLKRGGWYSAFTSNFTSNYKGDYENIFGVKLRRSRGSSRQRDNSNFSSPYSSRKTKNYTQNYITMFTSYFKKLVESCTGNRNYKLSYQF